MCDLHSSWGVSPERISVCVHRDVRNLQGWCIDIHEPCYHSVADTGPSYTTRTRHLLLPQSPDILGPRI
jgi:hypothetical protein